MGSSVLDDRAAILDRHAVRRSAGVPTVSLLVGPIGGGVEAWRRWAVGERRGVVFANRNSCPFAQWVRSATEDVDMPAAGVGRVARRLGRDPDELLASLRTKTPAEIERFWSTLTPEVDDGLLRAITRMAVGRSSPGAVAATLDGLGTGILPAIVHLVPSSRWPSLVFISGTRDDLLTAAQVSATWAMQVPAVPVAVVVTAGVWSEYLAAAPESRTKALLKEGEVAVPELDAAAVEQTLTDAGVAGYAAAAIARHGADEALVDAAVAAVQLSHGPPASAEQDDRARSAAERFLFRFLESLPETAGRFELNATLDFEFGPRRAEVDLLCRSPRVAIELDGYFHFLAPDGYRRDRTKDWELQRRGFVVLRFLAEDVIPYLETIRDRILDALALTPTGAPLDDLRRRVARHDPRRPRAGPDEPAESEAGRTIRSPE